MTAPSDPASEPSSEPNFLYFGFGSNLDIKSLHETCPSARLVSPALLVNHRLAFTRQSKLKWHGGVADVLHEPGGEVWGALWEIDGEDSHKLDTREGVCDDPPAYERYTVTVTTAAGDEVTCRSYRVASPHRDGFAPSPAYKQTLLRGARALALPEHYIATLEAIEDNGYEGGGPG